MENVLSFRIKKMSLQFVVSDLQRSIEFYTKELNFDLDFLYEDFYAGIIKEGFSIHLKLGKPSADERLSKKNNEDLDVSFSINNIDYLYEEITKRSINVIQPLREMRYGKEFYITDPDGYIIAFIQEN